MKSTTFFICSLMFILLFNSACDSGPKVISEPVNTSPSDQSTGIFDDLNSAANSSKENTGQLDQNTDLHTVTVEEVLPAAKYVYLKVNEGDESFWIATGKQNFEVGATYFYKGGLLKTNFESKEHNRTFDKIYLVGRIVSSNHASHAGHAHADNSDMETSSPKTVNKSPVEKIEREGSLKIADLVANPEKYDGKTVQVSGKCVKINPEIMGRNWIHLKDGSNDDYDLVITTNLVIPEGHIVTMTAEVSLNKDFGAGYKYDIILENGTMIQ